MLRVIDIIEATTVDGPGFRNAIYFAGCSHHCDGCHNPQSWSFDSGKDMEISELLTLLRDRGLDVTFTGGDPVMQGEELIALAAKLREAGLTVWLYTGYKYEQLMEMESMSRILDYVEVVVDGRFIKELRDESLLFRGSSNQRLVDVALTRQNGTVTEWQSPF